MMNVRHLPNSHINPLFSIKAIFLSHCGGGGTDCSSVDLTSFSSGSFLVIC